MQGRIILYRVKHSVDIKLGARLMNVATVTFPYLLGYQQTAHHGMVVVGWRQRNPWERGEGRECSPAGLSSLMMLESGESVMRNNYVA